MLTPAQTIINAHMSERDFQQWFVECFTLLGYTLSFHDYDPRKNNRGFLDWVIMRPATHNRSARLIVVELKKQNGVLSREQKLWIAGWRANGVEVYVWRPSDRDAIVEILQANKQPRDKDAQFVAFLEQQGIRVVDGTPTE